MSSRATERETEGRKRWRERVSQEKKEGENERVHFLYGMDGLLVRKCQIELRDPKEKEIAKGFQVFSFSSS